MISPELSQKRLEILRELFPSLSRVGVLWCGGGIGGVGDKEWAETRAAADALKVQLTSLRSWYVPDLESAFAPAVRQPGQAAAVFACVRFPTNAALIPHFSLTNP